MCRVARNLISVGAECNLCRVALNYEQCSMAERSLLWASVGIVQTTLLHALGKEPLPRALQRRTAIGTARSVLVILGKHVYLCFDCLACRAAQLRLQDVGLPVTNKGKFFNSAFFEQQRIASASIEVNELNASLSQELLMGLWKKQNSNFAALSDAALVKHFAKVIPVHIPGLDDTKQFRVRLTVLNEVQLWKGNALRADLVVAILPEIFVLKLEYLARSQQEEVFFKKHPVAETLPYRPARYAHDLAFNVFDVVSTFATAKCRAGTGMSKIRRLFQTDSIRTT